MISDKLYLEAEQNGITVICGAKLPLTKSVSVKDGEDMYIGIDDSVWKRTQTSVPILPTKSVIA